MCVYYKTQQSRDGCNCRKALPLELPSNQSEPGETTPSADSSSNASSSGTITMNTAHFIPESAEVDDTYFSNTLFIGNSITEGFKEFSGLDTPTYYEGRGMTR